MTTAREQEIVRAARSFVGAREIDGLALISGIAKEIGLSLDLPQSIRGVDRDWAIRALKESGLLLTFHAQPRTPEWQLRKSLQEDGVGTLVTFYDDTGRVLAPRVGEVVMWGAAGVSITAGVMTESASSEQPKHAKSPQWPYRGKTVAIDHDPNDSIGPWPVVERPWHWFAP